MNYEPFIQYSEQAFWLQSNQNPISVSKADSSVYIQAADYLPDEDCIEGLQ